MAWIVFPPLGRKCPDRRSLAYPGPCHREAKIPFSPSAIIATGRERHDPNRHRSPSPRRVLPAIGYCSPPKAALPATTSHAAAPEEIPRIDWATYNPVSLVLKDQHLLEDAFAPDKIAVRWVQSAGSNKALEFLNAGSLDFGSTAGAAALIGKVNGNPLRSIYVYSRPEWTALVTMPDSPIKTVADLKGQRVAVTRGTDPPAHLPWCAPWPRRAFVAKKTSNSCCCNTPTAAPLSNEATSPHGPAWTR